MHYYRFGQTLIDKIALSLGLADQFRFEFDNYDSFLKILDSGKGVVLIGAHVGNWEAGSYFFGNYGKKINIVLYDAEYEKIKEVLEQNAQSRNFKLIRVNEDGIESVLRIKNALDNGEYVCFQGDRYLDKDNTMSFRFMGHEALFPLGPFITASRLRVPVVFYYAVREPKYTYRFKFVVADPVVGTINGEKPEKRLLGQYVEATESILADYPQQWFNFYNFWG